MPLPPETNWLRANVCGAPTDVDLEAKTIHGYVVAQKGPFKSAGRGEFDDQSLKDIVRLMKGARGGLKSRFGHPTLSDDGLGKFLGRATNPRIDGDRVRADLTLDPSSFNTPHGDLGGYVLGLAKSDPDAFSSSLVLETDRIEQVDKRGRPILDDAGQPKPPIWRPTRLHASDVVDTGDAVDGFLSVDGLPDAVARQAAALLDAQFAGMDRAGVRARCLAYMEKYLAFRFGEEEPPTVCEAPDPENDRQRRRLRRLKNPV